MAATRSPTDPATERLPTNVACGGNTPADTNPYCARTCPVTAVTAAHVTGSGRRNTPNRIAATAGSSRASGPGPRPGAPSSPGPSPGRACASSYNPAMYRSNSARSTRHCPRPPIFTATTDRPRTSAYTCDRNTFNSSATCSNVRNRTRFAAAAAGSESDTAAP